MKKKYYILLLSLIAFSNTTLCQLNTVSPKEVYFEGENVAELALEKIKLFKYYIEQLTQNETLTEDKKQAIIKKCKSLFVYNAIIQTKNVNSDAKNLDIGTYLNSIANPRTGVDIDISIENIQIERVVQVDDNEYLVYGRFSQYYEKNTSSGEYTDVTLKVARVKIEKLAGGRKEVIILGITADSVIYSEYKPHN